MQYTLSSNDSSCYNTVRCRISNPIQCRYLSMTVTSLTTNCNIRVLNARDFLTLSVGSDTLCVTFGDYTQLTTASFAELINEKLSDGGTENDNPRVYATLDNCQRIVFQSTESFGLVSCTYNVKMLLGLYDKRDDEFPLVGVDNGSGVYEIVIRNCGYVLSTPILYLVSNLGAPNFRNDEDGGLQSCDVVMRLNNSFTPQIPIIANNGEFSSIIPGGCISGVWFTLVDANMKAIDILNPIYITLTLDNADGEMIHTLHNQRIMAEEREAQKQLVYTLQQYYNETAKEEERKRQQRLVDKATRLQNNAIVRMDNMSRTDNGES